MIQPLPLMHFSYDQSVLQSPVLARSTKKYKKKKDGKRSQYGHANCIIVIR